MTNDLRALVRSHEATMHYEIELDLPGRAMWHSATICEPHPRRNAMCRKVLELATVAEARREALTFWPTIPHRIVEVSDDGRRATRAWS